MKIKLTLQEKLRDLRDERKLTLTDVAEATGIPVSTLQRFEADEDIRIGYQDVETLARFYDVSADYLFGLTDLRQYRNIEVDKLRLSDEAVAVLRSGRLNNRLISEFVAHTDFPNLLSAMEVYIDRKVLPQMNTMNAMFKLAADTIKEHAAVAGRDEIMAFLQQSVIDEDEYLRYRISERFNEIIKSLFDAHKADKLPPEYDAVLHDMKDQVQTYLDARQQQGAERGKLILLAKQLGLDISRLSDEEIAVLIKALQRSEKYKRVGRRKG
jgi:transcriptional regulator with XRE-family HTH domain